MRLCRGAALGQPDPRPYPRQHHDLLADGTGASAARSYWEGGQAAARAAGQAASVSLPVGFTTFPGEIFRAPRSWVDKLYPNVVYFNEVDKGGHFAAWEEPAVFTSEIRAAFSSLR